MDDRKLIIEHLNKHGENCVNPGHNRMLYGIYRITNGYLSDDVKNHIKKLSKSKKRRQLRLLAERIIEERKNAREQL